VNLGNRAKIFPLFTALRGFDDEVKEESLMKLMAAHTTLSTEEKTVLSGRLQQVRKNACPAHHSLR